MVCVFRIKTIILITTIIVDHVRMYGNRETFSFTGESQKDLVRRYVKLFDAARRRRFPSNIIATVLDDRPRGTSPLGSQEALVWSAGPAGAGASTGDIHRLDNAFVTIVETVCTLRTLASFNLVIIDRVAVLALVKLLAHHVVEGAATEIKNLAERLAEVAIQGGIDYWIQQTIAIAEPKKEACDEGRNRIRVTEERSY